MEIETFKTLNEDLQIRLMMMLEVIALITVLVAIAGLAIYLAGITWFYFKETRRSLTRPRTS